MAGDVVKTFEDFPLGGRSSFTKTVTETDVLLFAGISGDLNPLHVDREFARRTRFGRPLVHGALTNGLISTALTGLGIGHVYSSQETYFKAPVFAGDTITATAEIVEKVQEKRRLIVRTTAVNQRDQVVAEGTARLTCMDELFRTEDGDD